MPLFFKKVVFYTIKIHWIPRLQKGSSGWGKDKVILDALEQWVKIM